MNKTIKNTKREKETIFIIADWSKDNPKDFEIKAINKNDFFKQIKELLKKKEITENWGLVGNSVFHKWFNN